MEDNRKIVIYGSGRYPKDFLYVFDKIQVSYYVDDKAGDTVEQYHVLEKEKKSEVFVIICKYDEKAARTNLEQMGFQRGTNYVSASELFQELDFPIKAISKKREIYVWGTGDISHRFFEEFVIKNPDVEILGCIDSDLGKRGKTFFRRPIYMPDDILKKDNVFFIIASNLYYSEIKKNLLQYGKREGEDFVSSCVIHQKASWMMRETIYDVPRLDYVCPKAFRDVAVMPEGRLSVCAGVRDVENYNVPLYCSDFSQAWHSNIMKILRLSMINGTYSFCDAKKCDLKQGCGRQILDTDECHYSMHYSKEQLALISQEDALSKDHVFHEENYSIREKEYPDVAMVSFDRTCNLHCPSCREKVYAAGKRKKEELLEFTDKLEKQLLPYVNRIKVAGDGEAFASEIYRNIIFNSQRSKKIHEIGILSNGTLLTPSQFDKVSELYSSIKIFISMDGCTSETAQKLRAGADFERWKDNMRYLAKQREAGKIDFFAFNFVVQRDNYLEMPGYVKMCLGFHADEIKFSKIFNWGNYTAEEFDRVSMFDANDRMREELAEVVKDEIFGRKEVRLFKWIDW